MSNSTPGPWIYDIHEGSFYIFTDDMQAMIADGDPDHVGIARMRGTGRGADAQEQEANARLIAAAPRMYGFIESIAAAGNVEAMAILDEIGGR